MKIKLTTLLSAIFLMGLLNSCQKKCKCDDDSFTPPDGTFCYKDEGRQKEMLDYNQVLDRLNEYDNTRKGVLEKALGYEDTRVNTFDFVQFQKYLGHIENLSAKANIKIAGISFISGAKANYNGTGKSYQDLMYIPTTIVNGNEVAFDPVQSAEQGRLVTLKEMLGKFGYKWTYDITKADSIPVKQKMNIKIDTIGQGTRSGLGNFGQSQPPM